MKRARLKSYDDLEDADGEQPQEGCLGPTLAMGCLIVALQVGALLWLFTACSTPPHELHVTTADGKILVDVKIQQTRASWLGGLLNLAGEALPFLVP